MDRQTDTHTFLGYYNADTRQGRQQVSLSESHEKKGWSPGGNVMRKVGGKPKFSGVLPI